MHIPSTAMTNIYLRSSKGPYTEADIVAAPKPIQKKTQKNIMTPMKVHFRRNGMTLRRMF